VSALEQIGIPLVNLIKPVAFGYHLLDLELSGPIEAQQAREFPVRGVQDCEE
jgi:hypothetical protein